MKVTLKLEQNRNEELEHTFISFKGKCQKPLIMVIKETWWNNKVVWADVLFSTK